MPFLGTHVLVQLFDHATDHPFSHSASFPPHTVTSLALHHSLGTARRRSFPPLNLHTARVRRKSRAASFKSLYRKRANTPCSCRRIALRASDTTLRLPGTYPHEGQLDYFRGSVSDSSTERQRKREQETSLFSQSRLSFFHPTFAIGALPTHHCGPTSAVPNRPSWLATARAALSQRKQRLAQKFLPIFRWAGSAQLPEHSRKVLLVLEPAGHRHIQHTHLGGTQHLLSALYPALQHKLVWALAR